MKRAPQRDQVVAASETVTLVLGEDSPLPESAADVEDLVRRLRGHVAQLGARTPSGTPVLLRAQRLCSDSVPEGYMPSRVYLVELAEATQELVTHVERGGPGSMRPERRRRSWKPRINMLRGGFRSCPRLFGLGRFGSTDVTVTEVVVIGLILGPMAWLVLRGERAASPVAADEDSPPTLNDPTSPR
ncbi:DUF6415 family natural product biosynthesis protein [Streptomyces pilosus]|uniref:DUF6415 family natural product biosynthesis protein n=1 Tax=Streptomyces pilosus TaxID=28893 RepID=UPI001E400FCE|nr:DUF6415 family natural product biosynthesis protein [Streptomyces pilosus]